MKILCACSLWRGSNDAAVVKAFSELGHIVDVVDEHYYINLWNINKLGKALGVVSRIFNDIKVYNDKLKLQFDSLKPDLVFVYKGQWVLPETLNYFKKFGCKLVNLYPDVSFTAHGKLIPACIPLYDMIFSTKSFAIDDCIKLFNYSKVIYIPHGFDKDIHKKLSTENAPAEFFCDASFIGTYSPWKEKNLCALKEALPNLKLNIWGGGWHKADSKLAGSIMSSSVHGDLYALAIQCSKINIALLSEIVSGASSGDQITSRTFHIPASGGFMLHQRTSEVLNYFSEGEEIVCFDSSMEMIEVINHYIIHNDDRDIICKKGYEKTVSSYSVLHRVKELISIL
jgi:spore maturation protein CgeB